MKKVKNIFASILLFGTLLFTSIACNNARTSSDAPDNMGDEVEEPQAVEETQEDATNPIRENQLDSDTRAREQRNEWVGNPQQRAESDLESEVRNKLEANIPGSKLTVSAEDDEQGVVNIVGTVPSQEEYQKIKDLAYQVVGVQDVNLDVQVVEPTQS